MTQRVKIVETASEARRASLSLWICMLCLCSSHLRRIYLKVIAPDFQLNVRNIHLIVRWEGRARAYIWGRDWERSQSRAINQTHFLSISIAPRFSWSACATKRTHTHSCVITCFLNGRETKLVLRAKVLFTHAGKRKLIKSCWIFMWIVLLVKFANHAMLRKLKSIIFYCSSQNR
jgi:hypothetical protein